MKERRGPKSVGRYVGMISRFARRYFAALMEPLDLPEVAFPLLMRLTHRDAMSQDELADSHLVDKSTVTRALARMEEAGLVIREVDEQDRRIKRVKATDRAMALTGQIRKALRAWNERLLDGFEEDEREQVLAYLQRMAENARTHWDDLAEDPVSKLELPDED